jgi:hypothetical protein
MFKKIIPIYSENQTQTIGLNTVFGLNSELIIKAGVSYCYNLKLDVKG